MFEISENIGEEAGSFRVACIGKTAEIWKRQSFAEEFMLLEGNPVDSSSWKGVAVGFLLADAENEEDVKNFPKAIEAADAMGISVLIPILISTEPIELAGLLTINPEKYAGEDEIYRDIYQAVKSIYDIACIPGLVKLDLCDVQTICKDKKKILLATGEAKGKNASMAAAEKAMSKLTKQDGQAQRSGKDVLLNVTGSEEHLSMFEIQEVSETLCEWLKNKEAAIIWGASIDNSLTDVIRVSILMGI